VLHQIGVGALGPVFRTYEPTRDRLIAVKVFRLDITPEQAQALADELARAADAGLFHPSIVEPVAAGVEGTVAYRAEEYVAAESLDVAMRHYAAASLDKVVPFIAQLAAAIDFARAAGIRHGALHPRDIFVTPDEARATGFGVVDALDRLSLRAPVRRPYSAPERVVSQAWSTPADIFSLAAIAFELLTGRRPSGVGDQIGPLTGSVATGHIGEIRGVLVRAMDEDPRRRYSTAQEFAGALEAAARGEQIPETGRTATVIPIPTEPVPPASAPSEPSTAAPETNRVAAQVPDDIAVERDEDEAHWELTRAESAAPTDDDGREDLLFRDESSAPHKTTTDTEIRLIEPPVPEFADEFPPTPDRPTTLEMPLSRPSWDESAAAPKRPADADAVSTPRPNRPRPAPVVEPGILRLDGRATAHEPSMRDTRGLPPERSRVLMLPMAAAIILSLLVGFAAGYAVRDREKKAEQTAANVDAPTSPPSPTLKPQATTSPPQPTGKEWSEQAVTPPASKPTPVAPEALAEGPTGARAASKPAATTGRIVVRSTPPGAAVTINGKGRGRTPLSVNAAPFGNYQVRVVLPGYDVARQEFRLSPEEADRALSFDLHRQGRVPPAKSAARSSSSSAETPQPGRPASARYSGSIFVDSLPRGARVTLDGKAVGTTPMRIPNVVVGSHVIRLELKDHHPWTNSAQVTTGREARVTGSLDPIR
jgi:serine/threonine protein kinase